MQEHVYSEDGLALTRSFEGLKLTAYQDVVGVWTIGFGHTGPDVVQDMTITSAEADALLLADLYETIACVNRVVTASISQNQFDALVDFCFNVGRGNFAGSTLLRKVNLGDYDGAAAEFELWVHAGGQVVAGLVRRRRLEAQLFCLQSPYPRFLAASFAK